MSASPAEGSSDYTFPFLRMNDRGHQRPRRVGLTEVRGPYYNTLGPRALADLIDVAGPFVDWYKIPGPGIAVIPPAALRGIIALCHENGIEVSAGGLIEYIVTRGPDAVDQYLDVLQRLEFDIVEVSAGMLAVSTSDYLALVRRASRTGMKVKAEVGIQFGAGGTSSAAALEAEGVGSPALAVQRARAALESGAEMIVLESEGVTESVTQWRTDVPGLLAEAIGLERVLFEAAEPAVFEWYVKNFGPDVNVFVDHTQVLHLEALRSGVWGPASLFGRVVSYKG